MLKIMEYVMLWFELLFISSFNVPSYRIKRFSESSAYHTAKQIYS